ncbi:MAG: NADP-dependent malic enzyme [Patescibacteria group bacterium]|nr:NADP-dependent malic enzyme [Patescibacteria group bacterium]
MDIKNKALKLHQDHGGKLVVRSAVEIKNKNDLCLAYTPGVAEVCKEIVADSESVWKYTIKRHTVAIISDGSAVLGLGNIGAEAALPVMEGKAALFKTFAGLDAFPICLSTQKDEEIITIVKNIAPVFGGINLEDITAPRCFAIEKSLQDLGIPVMHDDQHGTAVVVLAALLNAVKVVDKKLADLKVVISGAGAAGQAIAKLLINQVVDVLVLDSKGILIEGREGLDEYKKNLAKITNKNKISGGVKEALLKADVFIGVSKGNLLQADDIKLMNKRAIVLAMANPAPEIMPEEAKKGGAMVVATGRSDYPNQVNNVLAFPGIFKGALECRATQITEEMKLAAAYALASLIKNPTEQQIIPDPFDKRVVEAVSQAVKKAWQKD